MNEKKTIERLVTVPESPGYASVCLLSFNRLQFIRESIASLADPGYPIEVVVGDDGSQPDVQDWLKDALHNGLISKLYMNPPGRNEGVGAMVNKLFSISSGDPLIKSDQDLLYQPGAIGEFVRVLAADESIGTLGGFKYWVDPCQHDKMLVEEHDLWDEVTDYVSSCMVVPRAVWEQFRPWEEHSEAYAEDIEFKGRVGASGYVHGLTKADVVVNRGFGVGPSTVVTGYDPETQRGTVQKIHKGPRIYD